MGSINSSSSSGWPAVLGQLQVYFWGSATVEKSGLFTLGKLRDAFAATGLIHNPVFWLEGEAQREPSGQNYKSLIMFHNTATCRQRCKALYRNIINNLVKSCLLASAVMQNKAQGARGLTSVGSEFTACPAQ